MPCAMNPEYLAVIRTPRIGRILEKRSPLLTQLLLAHNLQEPKSVEFAPLRGCDRKRCFVNVERQAASAGGTMETGWLFWEVENTSVYTEAHAVWITPQGRRRDITPQRFPPERRLLFLPDPRVAAKRGITAGYKIILSTDPRVIAIEQFQTEMSRIIEDVFLGFGQQYVFPTQAIYAAAERVGLPRDMAEFFVDQKIQKNKTAEERFGV